jgi:hypothetical protein
MSDTVTITLDRLNEDDVQLLYESACGHGIPFADFVAAIADLLQATPEQSHVSSGALTEFCLQKIADLEEEGAEDDVTSGQIMAYRKVLDESPRICHRCNERAAMDNFKVCWECMSGPPRSGRDEDREMLREISDRLGEEGREGFGGVESSDEKDAAFLRRLAEHPSSGDQLREWLRSDEAAEAALDHLPVETYSGLSEHEVELIPPDATKRLVARDRAENLTRVKDFLAALTDKAPTDPEGGEG